MGAPARANLSTEKRYFRLESGNTPYKHHDEAIAAILSAIRELMHPPAPKRRGIGFTADVG